MKFPRYKFLPFLLLVMSLAVVSSVVFYIGQLYSWKLEKQAGTRLFQQSFSASINQYEYLPALLANDNLVKLALTLTDQNLSDLNNRLKFISTRSGSDAVYIMNARGNVIATSNFDQSNNFLHQNYSFRPYFERAISERRRQFYYAVGATTGIPGFFISEPVIADSGTVLGVVVVKLELSEWEKGWQDARQNILVADDNNVIILSGKESWRYRSIGTLSQSTLQQIELHRQFEGIQPQSIYSSTYEFTLFGDWVFSFWIIDGDAYLVNTYPINDTDWRLFYLQKNQGFIYSALIFFLIITTLLGLVFLYLSERRSRIVTRRQARENEQRHRRELETIIEKIHIGIVSLDRQGAILFMNEHAREILKINIESNISSTIQQILDVSEVEDFSSRLKGQGNIVKPFHETTVLNQGDSPIHVMFAISQVPHEGEQRLLMTLVNIGKRKQAEEAVKRINASLEEQVENRTRALRETQAELVQQSKVAALGQMAATIVHELSQPLSAMNSSIAAIQLKAEKKDWSGALTSIGRLSPLSKKMHNIIKLLKSFSYKDDVLVDAQDLASLIEQSLLLMRDALQEKNVDIQLDKLEKSVFVRVNPLKFDLVVVNIIQNAIDAMDNCDNSVIRVAMSSHNSEAMVTIEDLGGGIDFRVMGQLFDPYFTTKEIGKGLGLGLSICHEIIREYGGTLQAENTQHGAKFIIRLPLQPAI